MDKTPQEEMKLTLITCFKQALAPFDFSNPRHTIPAAAFQGPFNQHITTDIVSIRDYHMVPGRVLRV